MGTLGLAPSPATDWLVTAAFVLLLNGAKITPFRHKSENACEAPETFKSIGGGWVQPYSTVFCLADKAWVLFLGLPGPVQIWGSVGGSSTRTISP